MNRYKAIIAYDGTNYAGWQMQSNCIAVANVLQDSFKEVFGQQIKLLASSRTDAGVHALGQVATFDTDLLLPIYKIQETWNRRLPSTIVIRSLEQVSKEFHPRYAWSTKTYWYHLFLHEPLPFVQQYGYYYRYPINMKKFKNALALFIGKHDFRSFCTGDEKENTIRTIESISLESVSFNWFGIEQKAYRIIFKGPRFLRFMIRRIIGACLKVASDDVLDIAILKKVLEEKDPNQSLPNAPAKGLLLYDISYEKEVKKCKSIRE
jgi:tRNA pseudouridine38-40 synthase